MPRHADEERAVVAVVRGPPGLRVVHERVQILDDGVEIEAGELLRVIEVRIHRIGELRVLAAGRARSRRSGHHSKLRRILSELCVTAPCMGDSNSVAVAGLAPWGTGHFISSTWKLLCFVEGKQMAAGWLSRGRWAGCFVESDFYVSITFQIGGVKAAVSLILQRPAGCAG